MKLEDARDCYVRHSTKASDVCRQLALAGIAVVWIFKTDSNHGTGTIGDTVAVPAALGFAAFMMIVTLALDFLHYAYASAAWGFFNRLKEKTDGVTPDSEFTAPPWINWPSIAFFWGKLIALPIGYAALFDYLGRRVFH